MQSLQDRIDAEFKTGTISVFQDLGLAYDQSVFEPVVHEVFNELLLDFCKRIVDCDADLVLLAGQPTKLRYIQDLVQMYLPLHASRIVPMFNHYAGTWYPVSGLARPEPGHYRRSQKRGRRGGRGGIADVAKASSGRFASR